MRSKVANIVLAINILASLLLLALWWMNGKDDTWFYLSCFAIILTSFFYIRDSWKDKK